MKRQRKGRRKEGKRQIAQLLIKKKEKEKLFRNYKIDRIEK